MSDVIGSAVIEVTADTSKLSAGVDGAKRTLKDLGVAAGTAMAEGSDKGSRAIDAYIKKIEQSAATVGKSSREVKLLELSQRGATESQLRAADAALKTVESYRLQQAEARKAAVASEAAARTVAAAQSLAAGKLTANQKQQLGFQMNDLFVQIASGQSPLTALIQQGSQLNGTFGGVRGTLQAVSSMFTVTRVAAGGLAAGFAALAYAAYEGQKQSADFAKALALTGNAAGITEGQFNDMAQGIADSTKTSVGSARETLQGLVASGRFSGDALTETAKAVQSLSKATGQSSEDIVKQFVGMADGVGKWAEETNRSYHFLTAAQLDYIKTLEEQGNREKAIESVMQALNGRLGDVKTNLGYLESAWSTLRREAGNAWDAMLGIGRADTIEGALAKAKTRLAELQGPTPLKGATMSEQLKGIFGGDSYIQGQIAAQQSLVDKLTESKQLAQDVAKRSAAHATAEEAKTSWMKLQEQTLSKQEKMAKEIAKANALADKAGISEADRAKVIANIRDKYKEGGKGPDLRKATMNVDLEKIKSDMQTQVSLYQNSESILEATRSAGLLSEKEYYEAKRAFLNLNMDAQVSALEQENKVLETTKVSAAAQLENQKKIAENQGKITQLKTEAAAKGVILDIQQKSAMDQVARSYEEARIAAQDYLDTVTRQQGRDLASFGMGDQERNRQAGRNQIEDRYTKQREDLENNKRLLEMEGKFTSQAREQYDARLAIIGEFQQKALDSYDQYYAELRAKQEDGMNGASRAIQNYLDAARNTASQVEGLVNAGLSAWEDAFVQFATTGKVTWKNLADTISAEISRMAAKDLFARAFNYAKEGGLGDAAASFAAKLGSTDPRAMGVASTAAANASTIALNALAAAANSSAAALAGNRPLDITPGSKQVIPSMGDFTRADRGQTAALDADGAKAAAESQADASESANALSKTSAAAATDVLRLAQAASDGGGALARMPGLVGQISAVISSLAATGGSSAGSGGGILGTIINAGIGYFGGSSAPLQVETVASGAVSADFKEMPNFLRGGRSIGGPVSAGGLYEVNEKGRPELLNVAGKQYLMMGSQGGTVNPNPPVGGGATINQTNNFIVHGTPNRASQKQMANAAYQGARQAAGSIG